jgi:hypothetical protein
MLPHSYSSKGPHASSCWHVSVFPVLISLALLEVDWYENDCSLWFYLWGEIAGGY